MLLELSIENLALFERAALAFGPGLNVITGETGAGKSLLIGALELLLGERPRASMVRKDANEARVEGRFTLSAEMAAAPEIASWFAENLPAIAEEWSELAREREGANDELRSDKRGVDTRSHGERVNVPSSDHTRASERRASDKSTSNKSTSDKSAREVSTDVEPADDERELILCRALSVEGKTRAWVNHRPVTARVLRELASLLVEIHGQSEHQRLLQTAEQTRLLDAFGGLEEILAAYRACRARWLALTDELARFESSAAERRDRTDLLLFQARELGDAKLSVDEHRELLHEREVQRHASEIGVQLGGLLSELSDSEHAALDLLKRAQRTLDHWQTKVESLDGSASEMREAVAHLDECVSSLARFLEGVEYSPARLEALEARLYQIELLEKKYRTDVTGLVARAAEIGKELEQFNAREESLDDLTAKVAASRTELENAAAKLSHARRALRVRLKKAVQKSLAELGLERAEFEVRVEPRLVPDLRSPNAPKEATEALAAARRFTADGADEVEFLLCANPGETRQPLRNVASGGETARIMLALRTALAVRQTIPTLVFDEIDAGVGGRLGPKVGQHLRGLAQHHQILCVTHLPAIAALAHQHFKVTKEIAAGRTRTGVKTLTGDARVEEVADMIAGGADQATARAEARRLMRG